MWKPNNEEAYQSAFSAERNQYQLNKKFNIKILYA